MEFSGKTALITGAASGIALRTAQMLAEQGANVVMVDVNENRLSQEAEKMEAAGEKVLPLVADISRYDQVSAAVDRAIEAFGSVEILINCAGGCPSRIVCGHYIPFDQMPIEALDWGVDVNFRGPLYFCYKMIRHMEERKTGVIINLGSIDGVIGSGAAEYSAAKSGMIGLTKSLALLGAPYGVRCCCVSPGPVLTRADMKNMKTPLGRAADVDEVANLLVYLCSEKAAFITGDNYLIDGGRACGGM